MMVEGIAEANRQFYEPMKTFDDPKVLHYWPAAAGQQTIRLRGVPRIIPNPRMMCVTLNLNPCLKLELLNPPAPSNTKLEATTSAENETKEQDKIYDASASSTGVQIKEGKYPAAQDPVNSVRLEDELIAMQAINGYTHNLRTSKSASRIVPLPAVAGISSLTRSTNCTTTAHLKTSSDTTHTGTTSR
ncbi:hypothetical protein LA080_016298 [Diaporthe eres]|nr:hypothetical protein LA080_016298 [Diaporthe eres]